MFPDRIESMNGPWIVIGCTVVAAWAGLALSRRWKSERGSVDRMGMLLGALAILTALLGLVMFRI